MKTENKHYRQGDVLIRGVAEIPSNAVKQKKSKRIVLAHGAATGHNHTLETSSPVKWFKANESVTPGAPAQAIDLFVSLPTGGVVTHQEHSKIKLPKGDYRIVRQREYAPEAPRNVAD